MTDSKPVPAISRVRITPAGLGFAGLASIMGGNGTPIAGAAWQVGLGCLPVAIAGLTLETSHWSAVTPVGWRCWSIPWSASSASPMSPGLPRSRLPASVAAIGTMAVPVIGVLASAMALGEPLGAGQIAALGFTLAGEALATKG